MESEKVGGGKNDPETSKNLKNTLSFHQIEENFKIHRYFILISRTRKSDIELTWSFVLVACLFCSSAFARKGPGEQVY